ncbi:MAG: Gfo/Idh/MocA family oxidoreductase [Nanoarchaeota archaeon]|nr:Gfo/Idh/MocA family oxidoreductase [Nanoarchaeota archaeon]
MLKSAVIGVGKWGVKHVAEWKNVRSLVLSAVCDKNENLSGGFSDLKFVTDYHDLLGSDIDCFSVCTPNETHFEIAHDLLNSGKHVLLEKPMCLSSSECLKLYRLAEKKGLVLVPGHVYRFNNALEKVKDMIKKLGTVKKIKLSWINVLPPNTKQSIIYDLGPHMWDILNTIFEDEVIVSSAVCERERAWIRGSVGGKSYDVELEWKGKQKKRELLVEGSKAKICLDVAQQKFITPKTNHFPNNTLLSELNFFVDKINGKTNKSVNGLLGYKSIRWVEECLKKNI